MQPNDKKKLFQGSENSNPPSPDQYPQIKEEPGSGPNGTSKMPEPISKMDTKTAEMVQQLLLMNGHHDAKTMSALHNFQSLHSLASNLNSVNSLVAGLQSLSGKLFNF